MPQNAMSAAFFEAFAKLPVNGSTTTPAPSQPPTPAHRSATPMGAIASTASAPAHAMAPVGSAAQRPIQRVVTTPRRAPSVGPKALTRRNASSSSDSSPRADSAEKQAVRGRPPRVARDSATLIELIDLGASKQDLADLLDIQLGSVDPLLRRDEAIWSAWAAKHPSSKRHEKKTVLKVGADGPGQIVIRHAHSLVHATPLLRAARVLEILADMRAAESLATEPQPEREGLDSSAHNPDEHETRAPDDESGAARARVIWRDAAGRCKPDRRGPRHRVDPADHESLASMLSANQSVSGMASVLGVEPAVLMQHIVATPALKALRDARPKTPFDDEALIARQEQLAQAIRDWTPGKRRRASRMTTPRHAPDLAVRRDAVLTEFAIPGVETSDGVSVAFLYRSRSVGADGECQAAHGDFEALSLAPAVDTLREAAMQLRAIAQDVKASRQA